jgi:hypothetical protein
VKVAIIVNLVKLTKCLLLTLLKKLLPMPRLISLGYRLTLCQEKANLLFCFPKKYQKSTSFSYKKDGNRIRFDVEIQIKISICNIPEKGV